MNLTAKISLILILSVSLISKGQIPYYDAITLRDHMEGNDLKFGSGKVYEILDKYYEPDINNSKQELYDAFNATPIGDPNPFIEITGGSRASLSGQASIGKLLKSSPIS